MGDHRQRIAIDHFEFPNHDAALAGRDNGVFVGLAVGAGGTVSQTDIQQALLHGQWNDVHLCEVSDSPRFCPQTFEGRIQIASISFQVKKGGA